jgi:hypothetical protein
MDRRERDWTDAPAEKANAMIRSTLYPWNKAERAGEAQTVDTLLASSSRFQWRGEMKHAPGKNAEIW